MIKLVIFDMDGLMFDTERVNYRSFLEVTQEAGYQTTFEQYVKCLGCNARDVQDYYIEYFGDGIDAQKLYETIGDRAKKIIQEEGIPVKTGLLELLGQIKEKKIPMAVASGSDPEVIKENIERAGIADNFDMLLSSKNVKRGKPYPDVFLEISRHFQVQPEDTLVLEDSANGVQAALAGNFTVVNVPDMVEIPEEQQEKCLAVVESLTDVIPYFSR